MRTCQHCATPIATNARFCQECGTEQRATIGGDAALSFPEVASVAEENAAHDQWITRMAQLTLIGGAVVISCFSGISLGSFLVGASTFFVALLALFILFQAFGIDIGL